MRYEDASGAFQASGPVANDDSDTLPAGSKQAATGNLITGEGTQYGSSGADSAAGAHITNIAGKGGEDSSFAGGKLSVAGEFGNLSVDAQGNYIYKANANAPENVRDRFTYTLADNSGNTDTAALVVELGKTPVVVKADAQQVIVGPDGVVTLPPGVELSDIMVVGRNLVVTLPDGSQMIIVDGAIFVPQLVLGGVEVPATNVAALLIGQEPQPAAGELPPSSGGNFALPPPPLDPGVPLGDLIPPMEDTYVPPEPQDVLDQLDRDPEITIQPVDQLPSINASDVVDEAGLPARDGDLPDEPEGTGEGADGNPTNDSDGSEATSGTIIIDSPDGVDSVTINGQLVTGDIGQQIEGQYGTLTITGFDGQNILYSYVLNDNTSGDDTHDDFEVVLTDDDGDVAVATLTIDIIDDVPTARDDTDAVVKGETSTDGNVMTGVGTTSGNVGSDTVGADDAELTGVHAGTSGSFTAVGDAGVTIGGTFGDLTINPDGSYTYTLHEEVGDGGNEVFTYQLTDGDGDVETATLTIVVPPDLKPTLDAPNVGEAGTVVDEAGLPPRGGESAGTGEAGDGDPNNESDDSEITTGTINFTPGDEPATITINGIVVTGVIGQTFAGDYGTLEITGYNANGSLSYSYTLDDNVDHDTDLTPFEEFDIEITDDDGDTATDTLRIDIVDDAPVANDDTDSVTEDGPTVAEGNVITGAGSDGNPAGGDLEGADDAIVTLVDGLNPGVGSVTADADGETIIGQYGTLVIHSDGSYEYTLDNTNPTVQALSDGDTLTEQFEYTLLDGDGDEDTAILTITINGDDDVPTVEVPTRGEDGTIVDEAGLPPRSGEPAGTGEIADGNANNESDDSEVTSGVITYTPGDGATTITINGVVVTGVIGQTFTGDYGTLEITGFDPVAHTINYTYTLEDNVDHDSDLTPFETFEVVVSDSDGNPADDASGDLIIDIINDAPIARDDTDSVIEGQSTDGNVLTGTGTTSGAAGADTPGADDYAPSPTGTLTGITSVNQATSDNSADGSGNFVLAGEFGTLTINRDGTYTYEAFADSDPPEGAEDVFTYTIIDNDGNTDTATLTIDVIDDLQPEIDAIAEDSVDEAGLPPRTGEPAGTGELADGNANNESDDSEITSGTITFTPGDAPATVTINGIVVTGVIGQTFAGDYGTLEITGFDANGSISYTYTLEDNVDHDSDLTPFETFTIEVEDDDGDTATDDLIINIENDAPIARDDTDSVIEGQSTGGNVLTGANTTSGAAGADTPGADNYAPSPTGALTGITSVNQATSDNSADGSGNFVLAGEYGTLTINRDGTYTYEAFADSDPPEGAEDVFTYTIIDNDGNTDTATLTIDVIDDLTPVAGSASAAVDDEGLENGIPGGDGDINADTGDSGAGVGDEAVFVGTLQGTDGDGTTTFLFDSALDGETDTLGQETIVYDVSVDGLTLTATTQGGDRPGTLLFTIQITNADTGAYTLTLENPIMHPEGDNDETSVQLVVPYQMEDADGDNSDTPGSLTITFNDDMPEAVSADPIESGLQNGGGSSASANLDGGGNDIVADNLGADGGKVIFTSDTIAALESQNLTHSLDPLSYAISEDGQVLTGYVEDGTTEGYQEGEDLPVMTIELQPAGSPNDYTVTLIESIDTVQTIDFNGGGYNFVGGNGSWAGFTSGDNSDEVIDLLLTPMVNGANSSTMNTNANEGGVGSGNSVSLGEGVRVDTVQGLQAVPAPTPSGDYGSLANQNHVFVDHENVIGISAVISTVNGPPGSTTTIQMTAKDETAGSDANDLVGDGTIEPITEVVITHGAETVTVLRGDGLNQVVEVDGINYTVTFQTNTATVAGIVEGTRIGAVTADGFDSLEFRNVGGQEFKIGDFNTIAVTNGPLDITVPISVVDGDGDTVSSGDLNIHIEGSEETLGFTSFAAQEEQLQKTAANSNILTLAAAIAGAGITEAAAAERHDNGNHRDQLDQDGPSVTNAKHASVADDGGDAAVSTLVGEPANDDAAPADTSNSSSPDIQESSNSLDDGSSQASADGNEAPASDSGHTADNSADAAAFVAPTVNMPASAVLEAAANDSVGGGDGSENAQQGGAVEQVVAEALGHGAAPLVDAILAGLPGGNGELAAITNLASPHAGSVSSWDMGGHGAGAAVFDMMFKMDVATHHQDAVQPVANG